MSKLTSKQREALPKSAFAGPNRSYPVPDKSHAANAKARAAQQVEAGNLSRADERRIFKHADAVLGKKD